MYTTKVIIQDRGVTFFVEACPLMLARFVTAQASFRQRCQVSLVVMIGMENMWKYVFRHLCFAFGEGDESDEVNTQI